MADDEVETKIAEGDEAGTVLRPLRANAASSHAEAKGPPLPPLAKARAPQLRFQHLRGGVDRAASKNRPSLLPNA